MCNTPVPPPPEEAAIPHITDTTGYLKGAFKTSASTRAVQQNHIINPYKFRSSEHKQFHLRPVGADPGWWSGLGLCWTHLWWRHGSVGGVLAGIRTWSALGWQHHTGKEKKALNKTSHHGKPVWVFSLINSSFSPWLHHTYHITVFLLSIQYAKLQYNELKDSLSGLWNQVNIIFLPSTSFLSVFSKKKQDSQWCWVSHITWISACLWP